MKVLFIGRFQPFHMGHLKVVKYLLKKYDKIVIGIGSSQYKNTLKNPFSFEERKTMIEKTLDNESMLEYEIIDIPDIHNPPKWVDHVLSIFSDFEVVASNNSFTKKLFGKKGYKVIDTPIFDGENLSGKNIRKRIKNNEEWQNLVPDPVVEIIKKINGIKRIKNLD